VVLSVVARVGAGRSIDGSPTRTGRAAPTPKPARRAPRLWLDIARCTVGLFEAGVDVTAAGPDSPMLGHCSSMEYSTIATAGLG
jgi:hypothetical protein